MDWIYSVVVKKQWWSIFSPAKRLTGTTLKNSPLPSMATTKKAPLFPRSLSFLMSKLYHQIFFHIYVLITYRKQNQGRQRVLVYFQRSGMFRIACSCTSCRWYLSWEEAKKNIKCVWVCGYKGYTKHAVGSEYIEWVSSRGPLPDWNLLHIISMSIFLSRKKIKFSNICEFFVFSSNMII